MQILGLCFLRKFDTEKENAMTKAPEFVRKALLAGKTLEKLITTDKSEFESFTSVFSGFYLCPDLLISFTY